LLGGIYLARHPLLRFIGEGLVVEDALEKSDAIIVLSDDNFYGRPSNSCRRLFRQDLAPVVVASGIRLRAERGIAELMTHDLIERGVLKSTSSRFRRTQKAHGKKPSVKKTGAGKKMEECDRCDFEFHTRPREIYFRKSVGAELRFVSPARAMETLIRLIGMSIVGQ